MSWIFTKEYRIQQTGISVCVNLGVQFRDHNIQEDGIPLVLHPIYS